MIIFVLKQGNYCYDSQLKVFIKVYTKILYFLKNNIFVVSLLQKSA